MVRSKKKPSPRSNSNPKSPKGAPAASVEDSGYILTSERKGELVAQALALGDNLVFFPGRSRDRVRAMHRIRIAAERDAAELVLAPFFDEPALTKDEIVRQRDHIELFRVCESEFQARRAGQATATREFLRLGREATEHKDKLLRAFDLRFRNDAEGQRRVSQIRAGAGDADLVQDVSDVLVLASRHMTYLESCPRGEGAAVKRLREISPQLSHLLGAKAISEEARAARQLRDGAYTLVIHTERRIRAAAEYWFGGTERMKEYAAYVAPSGPSTPEGAEDGEGGAEPAPNTGENGGAAPQ